MGQRIRWQGESEPRHALLPSPEPASRLRGCTRVQGEGKADRTPCTCRVTRSNQYDSTPRCAGGADGYEWMERLKRVSGGWYEAGRVDGINPGEAWRPEIMSCLFLDTGSLGRKSCNFPYGYCGMGTLHLLQVEVQAQVWLQSHFTLLGLLVSAAIPLEFFYSVQLSFWATSFHFPLILPLPYCWLVEAPMFEGVRQRDLEMEPGIGTVRLVSIFGRCSCAFHPGSGRPSQSSVIGPNRRSVFIPCHFLSSRTGCANHIRPFWFFAVVMLHDRVNPAPSATNCGFIFATTATFRANPSLSAPTTPKYSFSCRQISLSSLDIGC